MRTTSFVKSTTEDNKKKYPWSSIVLDSNGIVQKTWDLKKENSAIIV
ncbi:YtfJ family protein, partial [Photobacterium kishitanii]